MTKTVYTDETCEFIWWICGGGRPIEIFQLPILHENYCINLHVSNRSSQDGVVEVVTSQESVSSDPGDNDEVNEGLDEKDDEVEEDRAVTTDEENNETVQEVFESREDSEPNVESEHSEDNHEKIDETKEVQHHLTN